LEEIEEEITSVDARMACRHTAAMRATGSGFTRTGVLPFANRVLPFEQPRHDARRASPWNTDEHIDRNALPSSLMPSSLRVTQEVDPPRLAPRASQRPFALVCAAAVMLNVIAALAIWHVLT
jgi:hypothetical protein